MEKTTGKKPPTSFPPTLEIDSIDSHIPSTPTTAANLTQIQSRKGAFTSSPDLRSFRLILQLEKTDYAAQTTDRLA
jgi:hypothetical protein